MRKKYHTLEEWRAAERERQKRWREEHRGYERLRAKNVREARAGGTGGVVTDSGGRDAGGGGGDERAAVPEPEEVHSDSGSGDRRSDGGIAGNEGEVGALRERDSGDGELSYVDLEGVDKPYADYERRMAAYRRRRGGGLMEPNLKGGHGNIKTDGAIDFGRFGQASGGRSQSAGVAEALARLEELKAKRAAREGKKGVVVPELRE